MSYTIFNLSALQRSSAIQIGRVMDCILPSGLRGTALSTRQSVVAKSRQLPMMNLKPGRKLFFSPPLPVDPASEIEEDPLPAPAPDVWNRVQRWLGDVQFDEFVASESEAPTAQPMSDQDILDLVHTENDPQDKSDDESEEEIPPASAIKTSFEFLAMIDQQKAFLK